jgi:hypothetical protein
MGLSGIKTIYALRIVTVGISHESILYVFLWKSDETIAEHCVALCRTIRWRRSTFLWNPR